MQPLIARLRAMLAWNRAEQGLLAGTFAIVAIAGTLALVRGLDLALAAVLALAYLLLMAGVLLAMRRARIAVLAAGGESTHGPAQPAPAGANPTRLAGEVTLALARRFDGPDSARELDATILRIGSTEGRNVLVAQASEGRMEWPELRRLLDVPPGADLPERSLGLLATLDVAVAARLARVVALQEHGPDDRPLALRLFRALLQIHGPLPFGRDQSVLMLGLALEAGDWDFAREVLRELPLPGATRAFAEADLLNPYFRPGARDATAWLVQFNLPFTSRGLAPVTVDAAAGAVPFDGLATEDLPAVEKGPKVTVVITSWKPDACLLPAVRSVVRQTWRNLEILLIDDASPESFVPLLEQAAALDPRIRLIRQPRNGGTYLARNRGMAEATGEYFTVHDSDDWAHPQRIEVQLRAMLAEPRLVSTLSHCLRVNDSLAFNQPGTLPRRENASSLMYRLAPVRERVGDYDASRKGADTEFALRLAAAFGPRSQRVLQEPLALVRRRPGSLSREEFKGGWRHPSRAAYRRAYEAWHASLAPEGDWRMDALQGRRFRAPIRFEVDPQAAGVQARRRVDVAFALDLRLGTGVEPRLLDEVAALRSRGLRVALLHMESAWNGGTEAVRAFDPEVERLLVTGGADEIIYTDEVVVGTLVVRDPSILQLPPPRPSGLKVGSLVITHGKQHAGSYAFHDCSRHAFRMFGLVPAWRKARRFDPARVPLDATNDWPFVVVPGLWSVPREAAPTRPPKAGSCFRAWNHKRVCSASGPWPAFAGTGVEVRLRVEQAVAELPASVSVGETGRLDLESGPDRPRRLYFATLDFYVVHSGKPPSAGLELDWAIEALASGCVLVANPGWRPLFGDAALYGDAAEVAGLVASTWAQPGRLEALRDRARDWVAANAAPRSDLPLP